MCILQVLSSSLPPQPGDDDQGFLTPGCWYHLTHAGVNVKMVIHSFCPAALLLPGRCSVDAGGGFYIFYTLGI